MLDKTTFEAIKDTIEGRGLEQAELEKLNQVIRSYTQQKGEQMNATQLRGLLKDGTYLTKSVDDVVAELVKGGLDSEYLKTKAEQAMQNLIINTTNGNKKVMVVGAYDLSTGKVITKFAGGIPDKISPILLERAEK